MIHAHAMNDSGPGSRFGAAHRVYFDTPPLKGLRLEPSGSICNRAEKTGFTRAAMTTWFHLEPQTCEVR